MSIRSFLVMFFVEVGGDRLFIFGESKRRSRKKIKESRSEQADTCQFWTEQVASAVLA